jgi:flagellar hook-length control protein FliK
MQLFASKMTELASGTAPGTGNSTVTSSATSEKQTDSALDENFKASFDHVQTQSHALTKSPTQHNSVESHLESAPLPTVDAESIQADYDSDWHELVSQSQAIDTGLNGTETLHEVSMDAPDGAQNMVEIANALAISEPSIELTAGAVAGNEQATLAGKEQTTLAGTMFEMNATEQALTEHANEKLAAEVEETLLQLSPKQLEQVAQHIFTRLEQDQKKLGEALHFVNNLKSGLVEMKAQLQNGNIAGIDLSALVQDSLPKTDVMPLKLDQVLQQLTNTLSVLGMTPMTNPSQVVDTYSTGMSGAVDMMRQHSEVSIGQLEQTKLPPHTSFDKSVNLFKPEGQQQLAEKVRWMNNNRQISAELRLDPEDLGAMQVKISMNGDAATVIMLVQSTQAREALEQATPRLREMLAEQGLSLGESSVNQDNSAGEQGAFGEDETRSKEISSMKINETVQTGNIIAEQTINNGTIGGIDYYA